MFGKKAPEGRVLAGFFRQCQILFWKNGKLFMRNKAGTFAEICMALLFIFMLVIIRFFADSLGFDEENATNNPPVSVLKGALLTKTKFNIYYYPNNNFVKGIVESAMTDISTVNGKNFTPISKIILF